MPALFVGHGSPMNAVAENDFTRFLKAWGEKIPRPEAILCVSAHWYVEGTFVLASPKPKTIHDFGGFPDELYQIQYPAPGAPKLAERTAELLEVPLSEDWGLDHGSWSVLLHMFPKADIPVFQVSLDAEKPMQAHFDLGRRLRPLQEEGILILGSGNIVHNLRRANFQDRNAEPFPWAVQFDLGVKESLLRKDPEPLIHIKNSFPNSAAQAVPTPDHYLPLLYSLAVSEESDAVTFPFEGFEHASISMRAVQWG